MNTVVIVVYERPFSLSMRIRSGGFLPPKATEDHLHREKHAHSFYREIESVKCILRAVHSNAKDGTIGPSSHPLFRVIRALTSFLSTVVRHTK